MNGLVAGFKNGLKSYVMPQHIHTHVHLKPSHYDYFGWFKPPPEKLSNLHPLYEKQWKMQGFMAAAGFPIFQLPKSFFPFNKQNKPFISNENLRAKKNCVTIIQLGEKMCFLVIPIFMTCSVVLTLQIIHSNHALMRKKLDALQS